MGRFLVKHRQKLKWRIDLHHDRAGPRVDPLFVATFAARLVPSVDVTNGPLDELADSVALAREHVIVDFGVPQDAPHGFDVVPFISTMALSIDVPEKERVLLLERYRRDGARDLACYECLAAKRALVVERDPVRGIHCAEK
jgi:hypothetical protein